jgi:ribosome-associated protein
MPKKTAKKPIKKPIKMAVTKTATKAATKARPKAAAAAKKKTPPRSQSALRAKKDPGPIVLATEVIEMPEVVVPVAKPPPADHQPGVGGEVDARAFAVDAARLCRDDHCEEVVVLDVRALSSVTDYIVIATGTSDRQMHSVLRHAEDLGRSRGNPAVRTSSDERATWLIADFVDVVVHLFEPGTRTHYDLEMLWGDAPRVSWERDDQRERDRAGVGARVAQ